MPEIGSMQSLALQSAASPCSASHRGASHRPHTELGHIKALSWLKAPLCFAMRGVARRCLALRRHATHSSGPRTELGARPRSGQKKKGVRHALPPNNTVTLAPRQLRCNGTQALDTDLRDLEIQRLRRAIAMATAGELHRAAQFLEFAREVRRGKRQQRSASRLKPCR